MFPDFEALCGDAPHKDFAMLAPGVCDDFVLPPKAGRRGINASADVTPGASRTLSAHRDIELRCR